MVADKRRHLSARGCQTCHAHRRECEPGSQQTRHIHPMLVQCCVSVADSGPAMYQHWVNVSCLLLVGKAQSCCIVCIGLLTKHADWPTFTKRSTAREITAELTARELKNF